MPSTLSITSSASAVSSTSAVLTDKLVGSATVTPQTGYRVACAPGGVSISLAGSPITFPITRLHALEIAKALLEVAT